MWSYGFAMAAITIMVSLSGQIIYFYTDIIGMSASVAGTIMMVTRIADAFTDFAMGIAVDRTNTRFGKARPWLLGGAPGVVIAILGLLLIPKGLGDGGKAAYALISNVFASAVICTVVNVAHTCLLTFVTDKQEEKLQLNARSALVNQVTALLFGVLFIPLTVKLGNDQAAWIKVGAMLAAAAVLVILGCFFNSRELESTKQPGSQSDSYHFFGALRKLFQNKYWVIMSVLTLVININFGLATAANTYYAKWILGDLTKVALLGAMAAIPMVTGFFFIPNLVRRYGRRSVIRFFLLIGMAGFLLRGLCARSLVLVCLSVVMTSFSTMPFNMNSVVMCSNVADYEYRRTGQRKVGLVNTAVSFGGKVGSGIAAGSIGVILGLGGYQKTAAVQTASAINSIYAICAYIPLALLAVAFVLVGLFDLDESPTA